MASSLAYPFSPGGPPSHTGGSGAVGTLATSASTFIITTATFPWHLFLKWLAFCSGVAVRSLYSLGVPPPEGLISADKLTELTSILNHMHSREDLYRRAIRELQDELDAKDSDRKKALRKLKSTKDEINQLTGKLTHLQAAYESNEANVAASLHSGRTPTPATRSAPTAAVAAGISVHATVAAAAASVWWFSQTDHAALQWKLVFAMFFPLLWVYVSWMAGDRRRRAGPPLLLLTMTWFLIGFACALTLGGGPVLL